MFPPFLIRLGSRNEIESCEPDIYQIDQLCFNIRDECGKARSAIFEKERNDEKKHAAHEEKILKVRGWLEDMVDDGIQDKYDSVAGNRVEGTGLAFVCRVQEWLTANEKRIFVAHGSPGVGKTYLTCAMISHHFQQPLEGIDGLAYIYFTYDDRNRQTPLVICASIVSQLLRDARPPLDEVYQLLNNRKNLQGHKSGRSLRNYELL